MFISLQEWLKKHGYEGFILPVTDEYQGEYSADYARRVTALTGFDGSAGMLCVTTTQAGLLVDGRYTIQAAREVDSSLITVYNSADVPSSRYLREHLPAQGVLAYDPALHTVSQIERLQTALGSHITLKPVSPNPVDALWNDQPARPNAPVFLHDDHLAGETAASKVARVANALTTETLMITTPDAICWLLNIRGADIPYNPLPLCYALLTKTQEVTLFIAPEKMQGITIADVSLHIVPESDMTDWLSQARLSVLGYDASQCPILFVQKAQEYGLQTIATENPITLMRALKNPVEQENMRRAHAVDGKAVTAFLDWFETLPEDVSITELDIVERLEAFRAAHPDYRGMSFATIAGAGEHGAIVHYRATEATNRVLNIGEALLVDSGGQYPYGTTDITRTLFRGTPPADFKRHFTLVLKGHIALATAIFPEGTTGHQLDVLARQFLWADGLDYQHGTGHGVGHYLCVHEGPQSISMRAGTVALQPGMVLSNEPGYYREGVYGIRIESLLLVVEHSITEGRKYLAFDTLTKARIDEKLVEYSLLSAKEKQWLSDYNQQAKHNAYGAE